MARSWQPVRLHQGWSADTAKRHLGGDVGQTADNCTSAAIKRWSSITAPAIVIMLKKNHCGRHSLSYGTVWWIREISWSAHRKPLSNQGFRLRGCGQSRWSSLQPEGRWSTKSQSWRGWSKRGMWCIVSKTRYTVRFLDGTVRDVCLPGWEWCRRKIT